MMDKKVFQWIGVALLAGALTACGGSSSSGGGADNGSNNGSNTGGSGNNGSNTGGSNNNGSGGNNGSNTGGDNGAGNGIVNLSGSVMLGNGVTGGTVKVFCTDDLDFTQPLESQSPYLAKTETGTFSDGGGFSFTNLDVDVCQENLLFVLDAPGGKINYRDYGNSYAASDTNTFSPFGTTTGYVVFKQDANDEHFMYAFAPKGQKNVQLNLFTSVAAVMLGKSQREQNVAGASVEAINDANEAVRSVYLPEQDSLPVLLKGPVRAERYNKTVFTGTKAEQASWQAHLLLIAMRYDRSYNGTGMIGDDRDGLVLWRSMTQAANAATDKLFTDEFDMAEFRDSRRGLRYWLADEAAFRDATEEDGTKTPSYKWAMETPLFPGY